VGIWSVAALSLMVLTLGFYTAWNIRAGGTDNEYDFLISNTMESGDFVEENALRPLLTEGDLREAAAVPLIQSIQASKNIKVQLLLDSVSEYLTGNGILYGDFDYLLEDAQPGEEEKPWVEQDRKRYQSLKNQFKIDADMVKTWMYAWSPEMVTLLKPYVLSGDIDIAALNEGREVLVMAPDKIYMQYSRDANGKINGGSYGSKLEKGVRYDKVVENDMFHPGDTLNLCRLYTEGEYNGREYDYASIRREDSTVRIGAVLTDELPELLSVHFGWGNMSGSLITTLAGLDAMGFKTSGYKNLSLKLTGIPDEQTESYVETVLSDIANRAVDMDFYSVYASRRESRQRTGRR
jgi:hypothetical protein